MVLLAELLSMGSFSFAHWAVVLVVILVLFGRGRISETMGDFGKGLREFRRGLSDADKPDPAPDREPEALTHQAALSEAPTHQVERD